MSPSFYKVLLDPSAPHLPLPPDFVSKHLENKRIPNGQILISANGGYSWRLKIKQIGDDYCFANGWNNVVKDVPLEFGDFLYFRLVNRSMFDMSIYGPDGCEMLLPPKIEHNGGIDEEVKSNDDCDEDEENDVDPFFTTFITKTHKKMLRLPPDFVELAKINDAMSTMTMKNLDGNEWLMGLRLDKGYNTKRYCLSSGWHNFRRVNELSEGDECVFKFIRSEGKLSLAKLTKKR
ncbi:hypothetical protein QVD17_20372 [Tagetes erecta]|uniref:TF-B3 domain-containing protein n=1 Tax=Tagetes erecta TaxID=13708 RepID=A0AAD8NY33_TARER|nr:hypothetical protein QVD17_20372 [Tagetes erecta]